MRPKIGLFPLTCRKKLGSVDRKIFFVIFFYRDATQKCFPGLYINRGLYYVSDINNITGILQQLGKQKTSVKAVF